MHTFGNAFHHGDGIEEDTTAQRIVATPTNNGYWILTRQGRVHQFGEAIQHGYGIGEGEEAIGMATTHTSRTSRPTRTPRTTITTTVATRRTTVTTTPQH